MDHELVVQEPFANYAKGVIISDPAEVAAVLASDNHPHVTKIARRQLVEDQSTDAE